MKNTYLSQAKLFVKSFSKIIPGKEESQSFRMNNLNILMKMSKESNIFEKSPELYFSKWKI